MVKVLFLGLLVAMMCGLVSAVPAPQLARSIRPEVFPSPPPVPSSPVLEDLATRSERSTNLSYITGTARKIQLFIKNRHLQLFLDGTVNGTSDASSVYTFSPPNPADGIYGGHLCLRRMVKHDGHPKKFKMFRNDRVEKKPSRYAGVKCTDFGNTCRNGASQRTP